ncbi:hypothetical protein CYMTET_29232 [Cymbomonas tetramitiformis]|uniref:Uncharacterized protein n=1 Tax=Cymbomonas tetramitiformis TaxID=36881 RepID=A0AAE0KV47_9CHLO|nr:hypothetical protein CYMTET_29232 [Cymbomonas tetramitiformis]
MSSSDYPGGLQEFTQAIGKVWYTQGSAHYTQLPGSSSRPRAASMTGEIREGGKGAADTGTGKQKEKEVRGKCGKGGKGSQGTHPRAATPPSSRPRSPLRGGTKSGFLQHAKVLYKEAKLKHSGSTNKDTTISGTWQNLKFTPTDPNGKPRPCRSYKFKYNKTVTHSLGRFGCSCTLVEKTARWVKPSGETVNHVSTGPTPCIAFLDAHDKCQAVTTFSISQFEAASHGIRGLEPRVRGREHSRSTAFVKYIAAHVAYAT